MVKKSIMPGLSMKIPEGNRAISIVEFYRGQGWDIVEYDNGGSSKFKIAEVAPDIPLDRMDEQQQANFIASILAAYDERLILNTQARHLNRAQVRAIYDKIQVGATALPKPSDTTH